MFDISIDPGEARLLFDFVDCDGSDTIDAEELVSGLGRFRVGAKFMYVMTIMHEVNQSTKRWHAWSQKRERNIQFVGSHVSDTAKINADAYNPSVLV